MLLVCCSVVPAGEDSRIRSEVTVSATVPVKTGDFDDLCRAVAAFRKSKSPADLDELCHHLGATPVDEVARAPEEFLCPRARTVRTVVRRLMFAVRETGAVECRPAIVTIRDQYASNRPIFRIATKTLKALDALTISGSERFGASVSFSSTKRL